MKFFLMFILFGQSYASLDVQQIKYRTFFGQCPSRIAGALTLRLVSLFEKSRSLKQVKDYIVRDKLQDKYFLSSYKITYNPTSNHLNFYYDCPKPLMKVQVFRESGEEAYTAILVENGHLFDPTYEVVLRSEKKLKKALPTLSLPVSKINSSELFEIARLFKSLSAEEKDYFSEVIVADNDRLTIILSFKGRPISAFLGENYWPDKFTKLIRMVNHLASKRRLPSIINLTNRKKVVVKFGDNI